MVYGTDGRNVDTLIVDGKVIVQAKEIFTLDAQKLYAEARHSSRKPIQCAGVITQLRCAVD
jgi:hypothetical protein